MARVERVTDPADERLRDFTHLRDVQLRARREPAEGLFVAEGETTIRRALDAGYELRAVLCAARWLIPLADVLDPLDAPAYVVDDEALEATTGFPVHRGALASFARRPPRQLLEVLGGARRVAVLVDLSDHTNVGAIARSAAALGIDALLLTSRSADPLYRRAIRTSMGAVFTLPWTRLDHDRGPDLLRDAGFTIAALTPSADAVPIDELRGSEPLALAFGAEGPGLDRRWLDGADVRVTIPMSGGIDSLNVAAAAAVAFYALGR